MTALDSPATPTRSTALAAGTFWQAAGVTAFSAVLFPRLNAVIYDHEKIWQLDAEARVLAPLVVVVALAVFALIGRPLWRGPGSRPATASLVMGILALAGILAYWASVPIILGGVAATLGYEGLRRQVPGRGRATTGLVLGALAVVTGAVMWLAGV
jgi:hypothetical protein